MKSKNPRKRADERACKAMSDYIRERDGWKCITCPAVGNKNNMDAGHFLDRRYTDIKFDERNVNCQCVGCNKWKNGAWDKYLEAMQQTGS